MFFQCIYSVFWIYILQYFYILLMKNKGELNAPKWI